MANFYCPFWRLTQRRGLCRFFAGVALVFMHQAVGAQSLMPEASGATTKFAITGFEIKGDNPLSPQESKEVLAPFVMSDATLVTLQNASTAVEAAFKAKGFPLHRVSLPAQDLGGKVALLVVKFVIGKVTVHGQSYFSESNILASVPELRAGEAPNFAKLAVQTAISNENPGKQLQVSLKESEETDKIDVRLLVKESKPWSLSGSLSNTGSDATGQDRLTLVGTHANVLGLDHQFSGAYTTSLERANDVQQFGVNYRVPFYQAGGVLGVSLTRSDVVGSFGAFTSTGAGRTLGMNYSHYLPPEGGRRTYLTLGLDKKRFNAVQINGLPVLGQVDRESSPLTMGFSARVDGDTEVWSYNAELAVNTGMGEGNQLAAYQSEDPRVSRANWRALRGGVNHLRALSSGWLFGVRGQFQVSPDALISGEQFGVGGATSVRGTNERPISGDSGLSASMELTSPELGAGLRAIVFLDGGWIHNHNALVNPSKPSSDQLVSVGLGLRYTSGSVGMSADWGRVVTGSVLPFAPGSGIPQSGDQKIHLNLIARF